MKWEHVPNRGNHKRMDLNTSTLHDPSPHGVPRRIGWGMEFTRIHALHQYDTCRVYVRGRQVAVQFYANGEGDRKVFHRYGVRGGTSLCATSAMKEVGAVPGWYRCKVERPGFVVIDLDREVTA